MGVASSHHHPPASQERAADVIGEGSRLVHDRALGPDLRYVVSGTTANTSGEVVGIPVENRAEANQDDTGDGSFDYIWRIEGRSSCWSEEDFRSQFKAKDLEWLSCVAGNCRSYCQSQRTVSVRLNLKDVPCGQPDVKVRLTYIVSLLNQSSGRQDWPRSAINAFADRDGKWGFKDFIPFDTFLDPSNGFVVNGSCALGIKLLRVRLFRVKTESLMVQHRLVDHDHTWLVRDFSTIRHQRFRREEFDAAGCHWSIYLHRIIYDLYVHNDVMLFLSLDSMTGQKKLLTVSYQFHVKGLVGDYQICDAYTNKFVPGQCHGHYLRIPSDVYRRSGWSFHEDTCIVRVRLALLGYAEPKSSGASVAK